jgi:hypothetical protein
LCLWNHWRKTWWTANLRSHTNTRYYR